LNLCHDFILRIFVQHPDGPHLEPCARRPSRTRVRGATGSLQSRSGLSSRRTRALILDEPFFAAPDRCKHDFDRQNRVEFAVQPITLFRVISASTKAASAVIKRNRKLRPDTSCSRNRRRHLPTVAFVSPNWRAICMFVLPEALNKIILARLTSPAGRDRELAGFPAVRAAPDAKLTPLSVVPWP
jgi:hypothetical protein